MKRQPEKYLSVKQAAAVANMCVDTLYRLIWSDKVPHEHIGSQIVLTDKTAERLRQYRERPKGHITIAEAIKIAGVSRSRMSQLVKDGKIKAIKKKWINSKIVWIDANSVEEWMRRRENAANY